MNFLTSVNQESVGQSSVNTCFWNTYCVLHSGLSAGINGRARGDASPCSSDATFILEAGRQTNVVIGVVKGK